MSLLARKHQRSVVEAVPQWQAARRGPRVLVESSDGAFQWAVERLLQGAGFEAISCDGEGPGGRCALMLTGQCPQVAGADVVLNCLDSRAASVTGLLNRMRESYPATPIVLETTPPFDRPALESLATLMRRPVRGEALVDCVRALVHGQGARP